MDPVGVAHTTPSQPPARERPAVDLDHHLEHASRGGLLDRDLVERPGAGHLRAVGEDATSRVMRSSTGQWRGDDGVDDLLRSSRSSLGEEPDVAEVDARAAGRRSRPGELGAAQDGAVAAEHDDQLAALRPRRRRASRAHRADAGTSRARPLVAGGGDRAGPGATSALGGRPGGGDGLPAPGVGDEQDRALGVTAAPPRSARRSASGSRRAGLGAQVQEVLDVPARPGQRAGDDAGRPEARAPGRRGDLTARRATAARDRARHPRCPTPSRPTSNCGLTMSTRSAPSATSAATTPASTARAR